MIIPREYQLDGADKAAEILQKNMLCFLVWEERTGKSLTALLTCEKFSFAKTVVIITTVNGKKGWEETIKQTKFGYRTIITNYHSANKIIPQLGFEPYIVILDESHKYISGLCHPITKKPETYKKILPICKAAPIIYLTATPNAQGTYQLYHQLNVSSYSPFSKYKNYKEFYDVYGTFQTLGVQPKFKYKGFVMYDYKKLHDLHVIDKVKHLFVQLSRRDIGYDYEPVDVKHYIELDKQTKYTYNSLVNTKEFYFGKGLHLECESRIKLTHSLYMLEGGVAKIRGENYILTNNEKVNYIKEKWGDTKDMVIMFNYVKEEEKLKKHFKNARILSASKYAEGIDLYMYEHLIIYSQNFSSCGYTQRRARQCHKERKTPINVNFLLCKGAVSDGVYYCVAQNKSDFVDMYYNSI